MNFNFKHDSDNLSEALGIDDSVLQTLSQKVEKINESISDGDKFSISRILEKMQNYEFTQQELFILAASEINTKIIEHQFMVQEIVTKLSNQIDEKE